MKKLTNEQFTQKARDTFGDLYDYSKVKYKNAMTKVIVLCNIHGGWEVTPDNHLNKRSECPKCKGFKLTKKEKIELANKIHQEKYDYSLINSPNIKNTNIYSIICLDHGEFKQTWNNHYNMKHGCPKCNTGGRPKTLKKGEKSWSKEYTREYNQKYRKNNPQKFKYNPTEEHKQKRNKYYRERRVNDVEYKLETSLRNRINECVKKYNISKKDNYREELGCNISTYIKHLESQFNDKMNWGNHGEYWEIDHIIPLSKGGSFHYTNTQPLTKKENRKKSNKL